MLQINWTAAWRWLPEFRFYSAYDAWCVELKWLVLQISLFNRPAAELLIDRFNGSLIKE